MLDYYYLVIDPGVRNMGLIVVKASPDMRPSDYKTSHDLFCSVKKLCKVLYFQTYDLNVNTEEWRSIINIRLLQILESEPIVRSVLNFLKMYPKNGAVVCEQSIGGDRTNYGLTNTLQQLQIINSTLKSVCGKLNINYFDVGKAQKYKWNVVQTQNLRDEFGNPLSASKKRNLRKREFCNMYLDVLQTQSKSFHDDARQMKKLVEHTADCFFIAIYQHLIVCGFSKSQIYNQF